MIILSYILVVVNNDRIACVVFNSVILNFRRSSFVYASNRCRFFIFYSRVVVFRRGSWGRTGSLCVSESRTSPLSWSQHTCGVSFSVLFFLVLVSPFKSSSLGRFLGVNWDRGESFEVSEPPNSDFWTLVVAGSNGNKIKGTEPFPGGLCGKSISNIIK